MNVSPTIPGVPERSSLQLLGLFEQHASVQQVWLFGSRAMGRHHNGSDLDLCLVGETISHPDRLQLMQAIDELLLPWQVDLALRHELPDELLEHLQRVGRCLWTRSPQESTP